MSTVTIHPGLIAAHIRPKTSHFQNADMEAWRLKYCLDNDTTRFAWADTAGGKGVIYRMTDEHGNECPYDFKNVQFKRYRRTAASPPTLVLISLTLEHIFAPNTPAIVSLHKQSRH